MPPFAAYAAAFLSSQFLGHANDCADTGPNRILEGLGGPDDDAARRIDGIEGCQKPGVARAQAELSHAKVHQVALGPKREREPAKAIGLERSLRQWPVD